MTAMTPQRVVEELRRTTDVIFAEAKVVMREATQLARDRVSETAPKGRTRRLSENITVSVRETQTGVTGNIHPREQYAGLVERGTGLYAEHHHRITPKAGHLLHSHASHGSHAALRFEGRGGIFFRGSVKGQRPQPFIERAKDDVEHRVIEILERGAVTATEKLFR